MVINFKGFEEDNKRLAQRRQRLRQLGEWHLQEERRLRSQQAQTGSGDDGSAVADLHLRAAETVRQVVTELETPSVRYYEKGHNEYLQMREQMLQRLHELSEWHVQEARRHDPRPPPDRRGEDHYRSMADFHERA